MNATSFQGIFHVRGLFSYCLGSLLCFAEFVIQLL